MNKLDSSAFNPNSITEIDLSYNQISNLSWLSNLTDINKLDLSYNQISDLSALSSLKNLNILYLNGNQVYDFSPLLSLTKLTFLDLSGNPISDLSLLSTLSNLTIKVKEGQLTDITFENWLKYVFDHPSASDTDQVWYWDGDWASGIIQPAVIVAHIIRAFENSNEVFKPFSDAQLNQGFWFLNSGSDQMSALLDNNVPCDDLQRCIRAIFTLFEQCFAKKCSPHLGHLDEPNANPLNSACYMWWDLFPWYAHPNTPTRCKMDEEFLNVMQKTLYLDSDACRESALHGLGHWALSYPQKVAAIIDEFLVQNPNIRPQLQEYASNARVGYVQ